MEAINYDNYEIRKKNDKYTCDTLERDKPLIHFSSHVIIQIGNIGSGIWVPK